MRGRPWSVGGAFKLDGVEAAGGDLREGDGEGFYRQDESWELAGSTFLRSTLGEP